MNGNMDAMGGFFEIKGRYIYVSKAAVPLPINLSSIVESAPNFRV